MIEAEQKKSGTVLNFFSIVNKNSTNCQTVQSLVMFFSIVKNLELKIATENC